MLTQGLQKGNNNVLLQGLNLSKDKYIISSPFFLNKANFINKGKYKKYCKYTRDKALRPHQQQRRKRKKQPDAPTAIPETEKQLKPHPQTPPN
jgi:hypothetical protein